MNAGENFQKKMDIAFVEEKDNFVAIYVDDITNYSKYDRDHIKHLEKLFLKCRMYGISLNPRKSIFFNERGKFVGSYYFKTWD